MAKKKKAPLLEAWCWYCDREFEDEKVLLQHQKAKHYKCPHCPRRLNTAGGLTVHLHQVHKAEPTFIENALPGRESFDVEIYGMTGIPAADLEEWKSRRGRSTGQDPSNPSGQPSAKRPKVESVALTPAQLKAQLEAHKALMAGKSHAEAAAAAAGAGAGAATPASSAAGPSSAASPLPPHLAYPGPPPPFGPPPGFNPAIRPPPFGPPPGMGSPAYPHGPPPGFALAAPPFSGAPSGAPPYSGPPPGFGTPAAMSPPAGASSPWMRSAASATATASASANATTGPSPHQLAVQGGAKSRMVYTDGELSPEERLALEPRYAYKEPDDDASVAVGAANDPGAGTNDPGAGVGASHHYAGPHAESHHYAGPPPGFAAPHHTQQASGASPAAPPPA